MPLSLPEEILLIQLKSRVKVEEAMINKLKYITGNVMLEKSLEASVKEMESQIR